MRVALLHSYDVPREGDAPPVPGAVLELRDWWDHRMREYPNPEEWRTLGRDHRAADPRSGAAVCRRFEGATLAGPNRVWMLEVASLEEVAQLMAEHGGELRIDWYADPDGRQLEFVFGEAAER